MTNLVRVVGVLAVAGCAGAQDNSEGLPTEAEIAAYFEEQASRPQPDVTAIAAERAELMSMLKQSPGDPAIAAELWRLDAELRGDRLLLSIEVEVDHEVQFVEVSPGMIFINERLKEGQQSVIPSLEEWPTQSVEDLHERLRPGEELPGKLRAALRRQSRIDIVEAYQKQATSGLVELDGAPATSNEDEGLPSLSLLHGTSSASHFTDSHLGCPAAENASDEFCWTNRIGNWSELSTGTLYRAGMAMYGGDAVTLVTTAGSASDTVTVFPGTLFKQAGSGGKDCIWSLFGTFCDYKSTTIAGQILDASSSDKWHWGGTWTTSKCCFLVPSGTLGPIP